MKFKVKDNLFSRLILLGFCILLIVFREIDLFIFPRFWAEEGQLFYPFALHHSVWDVFITPQVGYLTLFNSIVSFIQVKLFSPGSAPLVSTYLGFAVQLIPIIIILSSNYLFWNTILKKAICSAIIIVVTAPELWLNTTNSHFIFGLITFLIMVTPAVELSRLKKYVFRLLLFIGALTGPASSFLVPVFLFKAYREKNREKNIQAAILCVCSILQVSVLIHSFLYNNSYHRLGQHNIGLTINAFFTDNFSLNMNRPVFGMAMAAVYVYLFIRKRKSPEHLAFLLSFLLVAILSTLGSLNMQGAPRYAYLPTCILMLLIASEAFEINMSKLRADNILSAAILICCLGLSFVFYRYRMQYVYTKELPKWKDELAKYNSDKNYKPRIHPDYLYVQF